MTSDKNNNIAIDTILNVHKNVGDEHAHVKDSCIVVYNLLFLGFLDDISRSIERFTPGVMTRRGLKHLEKNLNAHIATGVKNMGANLVVTNIPQVAELRDTNIQEEVTCAHVYDTLEQFASPKKVVKMSNHTYVAVFGKTEDAEYIAGQIDGMLMSGSPICAYVVPSDKPSDKPSDNVRSYHEFRDFTTKPTTCDYVFVNVISCAYVLLMLYLAMNYKSNIVPEITCN
jgi:hypothetical protein